MICAKSTRNSRLHASPNISPRSTNSKLARERFGKSVLALAVRWVLDQGPTIALWGARHPGQLDQVADVDGWQIDAAAKREIDAILKRCIVSPVSPAFMAPPVARPEEQERLSA